MTQPVNPYVVGNPLRGEKGFFGRQDILEWVPRELRNPGTNALVLAGQRRIGKTSLLLQLGSLGFRRANACSVPHLGIS